MFFIAGIQPKAKRVDSIPRLCPQCGLARAQEKRIDHFLSLFFIPILRVKKGDVFIWCDHCDGSSGAPETGRSIRYCPYCSHSIEKVFRFCPYCGKQLG